MTDQTDCVCSEFSPQQWVRWLAEPENHFKTLKLAHCFNSTCSEPQQNDTEAAETYPLLCVVKYIRVGISQFPVRKKHVFLLEKQPTCFYTTILGSISKCLSEFLVWREADKVDLILLETWLV